MTDHATPNLPSRDFSSTEEFYSALGFESSYRSEGWMILQRGGVQLEFFPFPDLDPYASSFGCCIRLDDLDGLVAQLAASDVQQAKTGIPRYHPPQREASGLTIAYLIDPDGTLLRLIQND